MDNEAKKALELLKVAGVDAESIRAVADRLRDYRKAAPRLPKDQYARLLEVLGADGRSVVTFNKEKKLFTVFAYEGYQNRKKGFAAANAKRADARHLPAAAVAAALA